MPKNCPKRGPENLFKLKQTTVIIMILILTFSLIGINSSSMIAEGGDKEKLTGTWEATGEGAGEPGETLELKESQADCGENHPDGYYSGDYGSFDFCWELHEDRNEYKVYPEYDHSFDYNFQYELREDGDILVTEDEEGYVTIYERQDDGILSGLSGFCLTLVIIGVVVIIIAVPLRASLQECPDCGKDTFKFRRKCIHCGSYMNENKDDSSDFTTFSSDEHDVDSDDYRIDYEGGDADKDTEGFDEEEEDDGVDPIDIDWD